MGVGGGVVQRFRGRLRTRPRLRTDLNHRRGKAHLFTVGFIRAFATPAAGSVDPPAQLDQQLNRPSRLGAYPVARELWAVGAGIRPQEPWVRQDWVRSVSWLAQVTPSGASITPVSFQLALLSEKLSSGYPSW